MSSLHDVSFLVPDVSTRRRALPEAVVGEVKSIEPIGGGLSGASVYAVSSSRGEYVLKICRL